MSQEDPWRRLKNRRRRCLHCLSGTVSKVGVAVTNQLIRTPGFIVEIADTTRESDLPAYRRALRIGSEGANERLRRSNTSAEACPPVVRIVPTRRYREELHESFAAARHSDRCFLRFSGITPRHGAQVPGGVASVALADRSRIARPGTRRAAVHRRSRGTSRGRLSRARPAARDRCGVGRDGVQRSLGPIRRARPRCRS